MRGMLLASALWICVGIGWCAVASPALAPWLVEPISREISDRVLTAQWAPVTVRPSALGESATLVGAAGSVVRAIRDSPAAWLANGTR